MHALRICNREVNEDLLQVPRCSAITHGQILPHPCSDRMNSSVFSLLVKQPERLALDQNALHKDIESLQRHKYAQSLTQESRTY